MEIFLFDSGYDWNLWNILLLFNLQLCPYLNYCGIGTGEPLRNSFTCNLSSTCLIALTLDFMKNSMIFIFHKKITMWTDWFRNTFQVNYVVVPFKFIILIFLKKCGVFLDFLGRDTLEVENFGRCWVSFSY